MLKAVGLFALRGFYFLLLFRIANGSLYQISYQSDRNKLSKQLLAIGQCYFESTQLNCLNEVTGINSSTRTLVILPTISHKTATVNLDLRAID